MENCQRSKVYLSCLFALLVSLGSGCSVSPSVPSTPAPTTSPGSPIESVTITPQLLELKRGANSKFSATVVNATDTTVTWKIQEGAVGGTITGEGVYTAPSADGVYHVVATANAAPNVSATAIVSVGPAAFTLTGDLANARFAHTAIRQIDGRVIIIGGESGARGTYTWVSQIEQFYPAAGSFQSAGTFTRSCFSGSLLLNGDILLAGGSADTPLTTRPVPTASAVLLKNGTGALQPTGSMNTARCGHTASVLQDGRVLIVGGQTVSESQILTLATAELYDPSSGTFSPAGNMTVGRQSHTAIPLLNGKVLIMGGAESAEVYDPATNSFTATSNSPSSRFDFAATLLTDGRVLVTGGETYYDIPYLGPTELYDPATGQFTSTGKLTIARWSHTATLLADGTVLVAGGLLDADDVPTDITEIYSPATGSFSLGQKLMRARALHSATLLSDGSVLFAGGWWWSGSDASAEVYQ
jgi:Galactose oxidase, central domain